jgi:hypothetical protein
LHRRAGKGVRTKLHGVIEVRAQHGRDALPLSVQREPLSSSEQRLVTQLLAERVLVDDEVPQEGRLQQHVQPLGATLHHASCSDG